MPTHCCVPQCTQEGRYRFPTDKDMKAKWIQAVRRGEKGWKPTTHTRVCEAHFSAEDFEQKTKKGDIYFILLQYMTAYL